MTKTAPLRWGHRCNMIIIYTLFGFYFKEFQRNSVRVEYREDEVQPTTKGFGRIEPRGEGLRMVEDA